MATVANWDFFNANVQSGLLEGRFMNAAFTLIASGPPRLGAVRGAAGLPSDIAWPLGLLQQFGFSSNSQLMRLWELGSERSYFVRGRVQGQASLGRLVYHGPSLLRGLYAYLNVPDFAGGEALYANDAQAVLNTNRVPGGKRSYKIPPGYNNMWLELCSDVFSQPIGLLMYFKDSNADTVGVFYMEYVNVGNHGLQLDSGGTLLSENASLLYERLVPVEVDSVDVIRDSSSIAGIVGGSVIGSAAGPATA